MGERRQSQRGNRHAEWLGGLPGPHRDAALAHREPPHDDAPTRRVDRGARGSGKAKQHPERDRAMCQVREEQQAARQRKAGGYDYALAVVIGGGTPGDQGEEHSGYRGRNHHAGCEQRQMLFGAQSGNEHGQAVDERAGRGLRGNSKRENQPTRTRMRNWVEHSGSVDHVPEL